MRPIICIALSLTLPLFAGLFGKGKQEGEYRVTSSGNKQSESAAAGIHYALPENYFVVTVPILSKTFVPGPLCREAEYFFSLRWKTDAYFSGSELNAACKERDKSPYARYFVDEKGVAVDLQSRPDPNSRFVATYGGKFNSNEFSFQMGPDGILNKAGQTVESRKYEFFVSVLQTAASVAGKFFGLGGFGLPSGPSSIRISSERNTPLNLPGIAAAVSAECKFADEFFEEQATYHAGLPKAYKPIYCGIPAGLRPEFKKMAESGVLLQAFVERFRDAVEQLPRDQEALRKVNAEEYSSFVAAARLVDERDSLLAETKRLLNPLPSVMPNKPEGFTALMKAREDRLEEIERMFTGTFVTESYRVMKFTLYPKLDGATRLRVATLNRRCGSLSPRAGNERVELVWLLGGARIGGSDCLTDHEVPIVVRLSPSTGQAGLPKPAEGDSKGEKSGQKGLAYRVPAFAVMSVLAGGKALWAERVPVAQFGAVAHLQEKIGSGTTHQISLDPMTGALREVSGSSRPSFTPERVQMLGGAIESALGAASTARMATQTPAPPAPESRLSQLQTEARETCEETRLILLRRCQQDPASESCALALKPCP